jgi:hypothetical protein
LSLRFLCPVEQYPWYWYIEALRWNLVMIEVK